MEEKSERLVGKRGAERLKSQREGQFVLERDGEIAKRGGRKKVL